MQGENGSCSEGPAWGRVCHLCSGALTSLFYVLDFGLTFVLKTKFARERVQ